MVVVIGGGRAVLFFQLRQQQFLLQQQVACVVDCVAVELLPLRASPREHGQRAQRQSSSTLNDEVLQSLYFEVVEIFFSSKTK